MQVYVLWSTECAHVTRQCPAVSGLSFPAAAARSCIHQQNDGTSYGGVTARQAYGPPPHHQLNPGPPPHHQHHDLKPLHVTGLHALCQRTHDINVSARMCAVQQQGDHPYKGHASDNHKVHTNRNSVNHTGRISWQLVKHWHAVHAMHWMPNTCHGSTESTSPNHHLRYRLCWRNGQAHVCEACRLHVPWKHASHPSGASSLNGAAGY